jgi:hypothetical protein
VLGCVPVVETTTVDGELHINIVAQVAPSPEICFKPSEMRKNNSDRRGRSVISRFGPFLARLA